MAQFKGVALNNSAGGVWSAPMQQVAAVRPKKKRNHSQSRKLFVKPFSCLSRNEAKLPGSMWRKWSAVAERAGPRPPPLYTAAPV